MASRSWRFEAVEFRVMWDSTGRDVLPYPLAHRFLHEETLEEVEDVRSRVAADLLRQVDDDLERAISVLFEPEARVEVAGFKGRTTRRPVRIHAAVHNIHGAIAIQEPGPDDSVGGRVHLQFLPATRVAAAVISALPDYAAGKGKPLRIEVEDLHAPRPADPWEIGPKERLERFLDRPVHGAFHIATYPWGSVDNRHINGRRDFQITDFARDVRYAMFGERVINIKPTDSTKMTAQLRDSLERTVTEVRNGDHPHP